MDHLFSWRAMQAAADGPAAHRRLRLVSGSSLLDLPQLKRLPEADLRRMRLVTAVLPFRANTYVLEELIDWDRIPDDPIFRMVFPHPRMLPARVLDRLDRLERSGDRIALAAAVREIRHSLNPHPAGQLKKNRPRDARGRPLSGLQHKYRETVLFFPSQGQTCHSYCSFCFRWPQFTGDVDLRLASREAGQLHAYLRGQPEVTDLLVTGGDPLVMRARHLAAYLEPLLEPDLAHVRNIRIGTKALTWWPMRLLDAPDADELLALLERLTAAGKHVALMLHLDHPRELEPPATLAAIARLRNTGVVLRAQAPLLAGINDDPDTWAELWRREVQLGIVPYYMFVARDTGPRDFFAVPLVQAWQIFRKAARQVSGLARTVRGPCMSADPGKVEVLGVTEQDGEKVLALRFLQARRPEWTYRPFFARYDPRAVWLDQLRPAGGRERFFFQRGTAAS